MGWFGSQTYDRNRILEAAGRAAARRRRRRAIALYRQVLAAEPDNPELHEKLAPLLACTGRRFDAWLSFQAAAHASLREGGVERALALYRQAAQALPREIEVWREMATLLRRRGREREAFQTLLEGRLQFRRRSLRPQAIHLLRRARELTPWHPGLVLDLARLLVRSGQGAEARLLLDGLVARSEGAVRRRVCAARLRLLPTAGHAWSWLHAVLRPGAARRSLGGRATLGPVS